MDSDTMECTPPEVVQAAKISSLKLLPEKSRSRYELAYDQFIKWRQRKQIKTSFSENVLIAYVDELSKKNKPSTLWTHYSMLRSTLYINHNLDISKYLKLKGFIKRKNDGYKPKKAKTLTSTEINDFLIKAPDEKYLLTKVVLVLGISGACRKQELVQLTRENIDDLGSAAVVRIENTKNKISRSFTITGTFYDIFKRYSGLRPQTEEKRFFLNFQNKKCTKQVVGINKIGNVPKEVATFLHLSNPELYTGHTFRRSSATILVDAGGDLATLKRHGGWKSSTVAESYIDDSATNRMNIANKILGAVSGPSREVEPKLLQGPDPLLDMPPMASTHQELHSTITNRYTSDNINSSVTQSQAPIHFSNCYNNTFTFNFHSAPEK